MSEIRFPLGSYVLVVDPPAPWESSGESDADRESYVGHVGIVVEVESNGGEMRLIRFPVPSPESVTEDTEPYQRNIEVGVLRIISMPHHPISFGG